MKKKEFIEKWQIGENSTAYYKKRFPEILNEKNLIDYGKLDKIIQHRANIKKQVSDLMVLKKPIEIEWLFKGKNAKSMSHIFCHQLHSTIDQILVRDNVYKRYLQILNYFGVEHENISSWISNIRWWKWT